jgi:hypothetical protein
VRLGADDREPAVIALPPKLLDRPETGERTTNDDDVLQR